MSASAIEIEGGDRLGDAIDRAAAALRARQAEAGCFPADYSGPLFLLPGLIIAGHVTGIAWTPERREGMLRHLSRVQNQDGGFGFHFASPSYVLGTALNYVALRLLGVERDDPRAASARAWLHAHGGAEWVPAWGKYWLAVLGAYSWEGVAPVPPELWLLPPQTPIHPSRFWCHTRMVYLPLSWLYGARFSYAPKSPIVEALKDEIYVGPWAEIDWAAARNKVHPGDVYAPHTLILERANQILAAYEKRPIRALRARAKNFVAEQLRLEDESTNYLDIGPVSKAFNLVCAWAIHGPRSQAFLQHVARIDDYLFDGPDGTTMKGYNGSELWDLAFALRALIEAAPEGASELVEDAHRFLDENQLTYDVDPDSRHFRSPTRGAWPFSTREQGWPVSDCTGEGLLAAILLHDRVGGRSPSTA